MAEILTWGHGYLHHLSGDIAKEYTRLISEKENVSSLLELADKIVPFFVENNADADAVDLLMEVDRLEDLVQVFFNYTINFTFQYANESNF